MAWICLRRCDGCSFLVYEAIVPVVCDGDDVVNDEDERVKRRGAVFATTATDMGIRLLRMKVT